MYQATLLYGLIQLYEDNKLNAFMARAVHITKPSNVDSNSSRCSVQHSWRIVSMQRTVRCLFDIELKMNLTILNLSETFGNFSFLRAKFSQKKIFLFCHNCIGRIPTFHKIKHWEHRYHMNHNTCNIIHPLTWLLIEASYKVIKVRGKNLGHRMQIVSNLLSTIDATAPEISLIRWCAFYHYFET